MKRFKSWLGLVAVALMTVPAVAQAQEQELIRVFSEYFPGRAIVIKVETNATNNISKVSGQGLGSTFSFTPNSALGLITVVPHTVRLHAEGLTAVGGPITVEYAKILGFFQTGSITLNVVWSPNKGRYVVTDTSGQEKGRLLFRKNKIRGIESAELFL